MEKRQKEKGEIKNPTIIGAVLDLGYCFDLTDGRFISMIKAYYLILARTYRDVGEDLPKNRDIKED